MNGKKAFLIELLLLVIITVPAYFSLLNGSYFSMHDDQHIARLYLLDQGIRQGNIYPRWVGGLGFGYGYPLYNFYPPFIYYIAEAFHLIGLSYIWSIKLVFMLGFLSGALGIYLLTKKLTGHKIAAYLSSVLFTYFFYHAVLIYVRGALAEFIAFSILPFIFLTFNNLANKPSWKNSIWFGLIMALLTITHPFIAFPSVFFMAGFFIFYLLKTKEKLDFVKKTVVAVLIGLSLSAFFWLPSIAEKKFTLTDQILTKELASYKIHYIYPQQFLYSPWGYGGSGPGLADGMTFQLGKIHTGLIIVAIVLSIIYLVKRKMFDTDLQRFYFFTFFLFFSLLMTTGYSSFIWDRVSYLWYLQFPWRFLTFSGVFISICGGYAIYLLSKLTKKNIMLPVTVILIVATIFIYQKYFKPGKLIATNDSEKTSFEEISWRVSSTSFEFVPKGVKTKKSSLGNTILDIKKNDLPKSPYQVYSTDIEVKTEEDKFQLKKFSVTVFRPSVFLLNTYNFPGWTAYIDGKQAEITDNNFKLITINIPIGQHEVLFKFQNTPIRKIADTISIISFLMLIIFYKCYVCE